MMKFYNKVFPSSYHELITYYPRFYRDVLEMDAILRAEGWLIDGIEAGIERVFYNCFIKTADEETISKLEQFIGIEVTEGSTLEDRRNAVMSYFVGFGKVSATSIKELLSVYTSDPIDIIFEPADEAKNNRLDISINRNTPEGFSVLDVMKTLARRLPAHIWYQVDVKHTINSNLYLGSAYVTVKHVTLTSEEI